MALDQKTARTCCHLVLCSTDVFLFKENGEPGLSFWVLCIPLHKSTMTSWPCCFSIVADGEIGGRMRQGYMFSISADALCWAACHIKHSVCSYRHTDAMQ